MKLLDSWLNSAEKCGYLESAVKDGDLYTIIANNKSLNIKERFQDGNREVLLWSKANPTKLYKVIGSGVEKILPRLIVQYFTGTKNVKFIDNENHVHLYEDVGIFPESINNGMVRFSDAIGRKWICSSSNVPNVTLSFYKILYDGRTDMSALMLPRLERRDDVKVLKSGVGGRQVEVYEVPKFDDITDVPLTSSVEDLKRAIPNVEEYMLFPHQGDVPGYGVSIVSGMAVSSADKEFIASAEGKVGSFIGSSVKRPVKSGTYTVPSASEVHQVDGFGHSYNPKDQTDSKDRPASSGENYTVPTAQQVGVSSGFEDEQGISDDDSITAGVDTVNGYHEGYFPEHHYPDDYVKRWGPEVKITGVNGIDQNQASYINKLHHDIESGVCSFKEAVQDLVAMGWSTDEARNELASSLRSSATGVSSLKCPVKSEFMAGIEGIHDKYVSGQIGEDEASQMLVALDPSCTDPHSFVADWGREFNVHSSKNLQFLVKSAKGFKFKLFDTGAFNIEMGHERDGEHLFSSVRGTCDVGPVLSIASKDGYSFQDLLAGVDLSQSYVLSEFKAYIASSAIMTPVNSAPLKRTLDSWVVSGKELDAELKRWGLGNPGRVFQSLDVLGVDLDGKSTFKVPVKSDAEKEYGTEAEGWILINHKNVKYDVNRNPIQKNGMYKRVDGGWQLIPSNAGGIGASFKRPVKSEGSLGFQKPTSN